MTRNIVKYAALVSIVAGLTGSVTASQAASESATLDAVKARGELICGVDTGMPGFAFQDSSGEWKGLDVSYCRAIAAAVLGDPQKVKFIGTTSKVRFTVLQSREIDVLVRDSEYTLARNSQLRLMEPAVNFYTGQTFMARKSLGVSHVKELDGATICVLTGTTLETNIADYNRAMKIKINTLLFDKPEEAFAAADAQRCDGYTDDSGSVAAARSTMKVPEDWVILPETISSQAQGAFTRYDDDQWTTIVKWTHGAMLKAEALGITKANVDELKSTSTDPQVKKFLGVEGELGGALGLNNDFAYQIVKGVGNYAEVYDEYFGSKGLQLPRGLNELYTKGGLQYVASWY
ncbi:amino acid ABC transporter substrate-binding protein [Mesorhizobium sp. M00.F.Ca.ET.216.01.1.1]|uniref:amino acid ABC transporter substrate-binding protein n=1 Tax=Mesorhizobium sp. M00.F.Ca.ET.216.01.1.1 TaxID=2500528 RepID=UPI000FD7B63F|nr:amino acid ABC transporter substrate-binding protein [Mesorhizobium sp. M00.F.Ca.ET.216.01.1.1]TGQ30413.1 amino acid ABC transporter substrate-binding protein [Mesorhizobium sp. M00.F.Ca.ET.216.01.1.1]TJW03695.1 MAG: amino acid ABC transporter substrate-binding protein [Mesorhizobium sp.]